MGMRFEENEDENIVAEINITPLTDVFLVLLIIFMISSSAMLEGGFNVKLPSAKSTSISNSSTNKPVYITVAQGGQIAVNSKTATEETLIETLKSELALTEERTVVIRGDESVFLGNAVKIMDAARAAGAEKIAIATQPPEN